MPWDGLAHLVDGTRMSPARHPPRISPQVVSTHTLDQASEFTPHLGLGHRPRRRAPAPICPAHDTLAALHRHLTRTQVGR